MRTACGIGGCGELALEGRAFCAAHTVTDSKPRENPLPKGWARLRAEILSRDVYCQWPGCPNLACEADHIIARDDGGSDDEDNLQGMCPSCHATKTVLDKARNKAVQAIRYVLCSPDSAKLAVIESAGGLTYDEPSILRQLTWSLRGSAPAKELRETATAYLRRAILGGLILNPAMPAYCVLEEDDHKLLRLAKWLRAK